jgi:phosphoenolpyruvate carboxykinase (GTP)
MNLMKASMQGKKMYVIPYLMGPIDCPVTQAGIELTNSRYVALHMILMTKAGRVALTRSGGRGTIPADSIVRAI